MATVETQRLFFALWPDDKVRARLQRLSGNLIHKGGKPVAVDKLHITLAFLGYVDARTRDCLERVAGDIRQPPFPLKLERLGYWSRSRVLWLGCAQQPESLLGLVDDLSGCLRACGREPERRPYHTHLTLARKVSRAATEQAIEPVEWVVDRFCLVQSDTLPEGAVYTVLRSWPLRP